MMMMGEGVAVSPPPGRSSTNHDAVSEPSIGDVSRSSPNLQIHPQPHCSNAFVSDLEKVRRLPPRFFPSSSFNLMFKYFHHYPF